MGYSQAGFDVIGVDINPQPNYPFEFHQGDALEVLRSFDWWRMFVDAIHASPPCQRYSDLAKRNGNADDWPDYIPELRELLDFIELPYIIENVDGAPLKNPIVLCGTMFPELRVIRHRLFESNFTISVPEHKSPHPKVFTYDKRKSHYGKLDQNKSFIQVTGGGNSTVKNAREAMNIDWMTKEELNESIPPAYTEYIGKQLISSL